nr:MAG TPA: hypothetical protein [Caudoviricetes sp.]
MVMTSNSALRNKFFLDCNDFPAPFPPEVAEKLRGTFAKVCLNEHFITVLKDIYCCTWYYDTTNQEYVIKTEVPHVCITRGTLEYLLDELDELFCGDVA